MVHLTAKWQPLNGQLVMKIHTKLIVIHLQMLNRAVSGQFLGAVKDQKVDVKQMWGEAKQGISVQVISNSRDHDI